jgi:hypothetical protein
MADKLRAEIGGRSSRDVTPFGQQLVKEPNVRNRIQRLSTDVAHAACPADPLIEALRDDL